MRIRLLWCVVDVSDMDACILYCSAVEIIELIETRFFSDNAEAAVIFNDLQMVLDGIKGIQSLKNLLVFTVPVAEVMILCMFEIKGNYSNCFQIANFVYLTRLDQTKALFILRWYHLSWLCILYILFTR